MICVSIYGVRAKNVRLKNMAATDPAALKDIESAPNVAQNKLFRKSSWGVVCNLV